MMKKIVLAVVVLAGCADRPDDALTATDWSVALNGSHCEAFVSFGHGGYAESGTACYPDVGGPDKIQIERGTYEIEGHALVIATRGACGEQHVSRTTFDHPEANQLLIGTQEWSRRENGLALAAEPSATVGCFAPDMTFEPLH